MTIITLTRLTDDDREQFILDNQRAFRYGAMEEFGRRDVHFEENGDAGEETDGMFRFEKRRKRR